MAINYENAADYNVLQLVKDAESQQLFIPEFQRHFIWDKLQIKLLIDSIYRKYTFGSILIWNGTGELARRRVGGSIAEIITPSDNSQNTVSYILDGQQRTTSLLMVLSEVKVFKGKNRKTENRTLYFDSEAPENDPERLFVFEDEIIEINGEEVILKKLSEKEIFQKYKGRFVNLRYVYQYKIPEKANELQMKIQGYLDNDLNETIKYITTLNNLADKILSRRVSLIFQTGELENVLEVFERLNTKNTKLSIYDVMVAKTYYKLQEDGTEFTFNLNKFVKMVSYRAGISDKYLKNETDIELDTVDLIPKEDEATLLFLIMQIIKGAFVQKEILKLTAQELYINMKTINRTLINALEELERFYINPDKLGSFIPILKLVVALYEKHQNLGSPQAKNLISFWFWNTLIYNRYPGAQNERIQRDFENIDFANETKTKNYIIKERTRDFSKADLFECFYDRKNEQIYLAFITLFQNNAPKDFYSGIDLNHTSKSLEHHHIFPLSSDFAKNYKNQNSDPDTNLINNIANIALLTDETNNKIRKKNPSVYIKELEEEYIRVNKKDKFDAIMHSQFIDDEMVEMLKNDQFEDFIKRRTTLIKDRIDQLCER